MKLVVTSRRAFLRGAASSLALPFFPSLARAQAAPPVRLAFFFAPCGIHMPAWTPSLTGLEYDLPYILEPLAAIQSKVSVLSGLDNEAAIYPVAGDHARGTGTFLTCSPLAIPTDPILNGISVDQVAAQALGSATPMPSLELGLEGGASTGDCDSGYSCAYVRSIAWAGPRSPLPKTTDAKLLFDRLFAGMSPTLSAEAAARRTVLRHSVLDHAADDAESLALRLSYDDRQKLDQYLTSVRELETRIDALDTLSCPIPQRPESTQDRLATLEALLDIAVLAFECDLTRVVTFMLGNGGSNATFPFLGVTGAHHELSHHQGRPGHHAALMEIGRWEVGRFAAFLQRLDARRDESGTSLLDQSLVMFGSEIADGDAHGHRDLPVLLAGGGGGAVVPGRHLVYESEPVANLYLSMLDAFGAPQSSFGLDGTHALPGLS